MDAGLGGTPWAGLGDRIVSHGLCDPRVLVAAMATDIPDFVDAIFESKAPPLTEDADAFDSVKSFVAAVKHLADFERRREAAQSELLLEDAAVVLKRRRAEEEETSQSSMGAGRPRQVGPGSLTLRRLATRAGGTASLAQVEAKAMDRWAGRFKRALAEAEAPSLEAAAASTDPGIYLRGLLGGSRASTVRFRLRVWEAYARWMMTRRGRR